MHDLLTKTNEGNLTGRRVFAVRVNNNTPDILGAIALRRGFYYIGKGGERLGASGALMDAIASGQIKLVE